MNLIGSFSCWPRFDPIAYAEDVKIHPEKYMTMQEIVYEAEVLRQVGLCETIEVLQSLFSEQWRKAKCSANKDFMHRLEERKNKRKGELPI